MSNLPHSNLSNDEIFGVYSDMFKDANGFRPRGKLADRFILADAVTRERILTDDCGQPNAIDRRFNYGILTCIRSDESDSELVSQIDEVLNDEFHVEPCPEHIGSTRPDSLQLDPDRHRPRRRRRRLRQLSLDRQRFTDRHRWRWSRRRL